MGVPSDHTIHQPSGPPLDGPSYAAPGGRLDQARAELLRAWRGGQRTPVEAFLGRDPALATDTDAVVELVYTEFLLRVDAGEAPSPEEYLGRFPQHAAAPLERLARGPLEVVQVEADIQHEVVQRRKLGHPGRPPS